MPKKQTEAAPLEKEPKRYKCDKCGATFTDPEMLEKHIKTHTTVGTPGLTSEGEQTLQGQPRTPPSSPPPEPMPPTAPQPG